MKRSRTIRFDLSEREFGEIRAAAEQAGLAKGAFVAQAALAMARGRGLPPDSPHRQALSEFIRAAGLVRRIGVNLNQAVAKLNATGQRSGDQARWEDSLRARAAIRPHSPFPCSTSCWHPTAAARRTPAPRSAPSGT